MSTHCYLCIIHPQHNKVGVCGLCVRERLVALVDECSSTSSMEGKKCTSPASGTASADGPYHSFSSSSAREHHNQFSPPGAPPVEPRSGTEQPIHLPSPAATSLLQKLKMKAFLSIPPSPERAFLKSTAGFHSPSPTVFHQKNKLSLPLKSRKSSGSELMEGLYMHSKVAPEAGDDQISAPSMISTVGQRKPSLMTLFHQSEVAADTTSHTALEGPGKAIHAPWEERRRRIEQFSEATRSPGFPLPSTKTTALSEFSQIYTAEHLAGYRAGAADPGLAEQSSNSSSSSWIVSLFQRKKGRAASKSRSKAMVSEALLLHEALEEVSARNSVDHACVSADSGGMTPSLKQMRISRVQHGEATNNQSIEVGAKPSYAHGGWPAPNAKLEPATKSTIKMGIQNKQYLDNHEAHGAPASEQAQHFPRSRSWGRAWSRTHSSQFVATSPQHQVLVSSKQPLNNNNVKLSYLQQQQYRTLTPTPKHPTLDSAAPKDSRPAIGFYFGPFRRSKRQGSAPT